MKHAVACLLILTLVVPTEAREQTPLEQARKVKLGAWVIVTFKDNTTLSGRLKQVAQDHLTIEQPGRVWSSRELLLQDVRKVAVVKESPIVARILDEALMIPAAAIFFPYYLLSCGVLRHNCEGP